MNVNGLKSAVAKIDFYAGKIYNWMYVFGVSLIGRIIYPVQIIRNRKQFVNAASYFPEKERKSFSERLLDQMWWSIKYGDINKYYFMWGGDVKGRSLKGYVPWFKWVNARQQLNKAPRRPAYDFYNSVCLLRDKFYFETVLNKAGYSTPANLMMINDAKLYLLDSTCKPSTAMDLNVILDHEIDAFCKRNVGYGGGMDDDVFSLRVSARRIFIRDKEISFEEFCRIVSHGKSSWVIQERINNQNQFMSQFHPSSVNTIRIVTVRSQDKTIDAICSFARFGVNGRGSDNWSSGGVLVGIDIENGKFEDYGLMRPGIGTRTFMHPNTEVAFKDKIVPEWRKTIDYVKSLHELFYDIHSIGWDICLTDDGPVIIEGNDNWDTIDAQFYRPGKDIFDRYFKTK